MLGIFRSHPPPWSGHPAAKLFLDPADGLCITLWQRYV